MCDVSFAIIFGAVWLSILNLSHLLFNAKAFLLLNALNWVQKQNRICRLRRRKLDRSWIQFWLQPNIQADSNWQKCNCVILYKISSPVIRKGPLLWRVDKKWLFDWKEGGESTACWWNSRVATPIWTTHHHHLISQPLYDAYQGLCWRTCQGIAVNGLQEYCSFFNFLLFVRPFVRDVTSQLYL